MMATANSEIILKSLEEFRKTMTANVGLNSAELLCKKIGVTVEENPEGGLIIKVDGYTIHVFQPYPDIDKIYYEY